MRKFPPLKLFPPLKPDHPLVDSEQHRCPGCGERFAAGDVTTLIAVGPGDDPEARHRARVGRPYNAVALAAHWACVTGEDQPALLSEAHPATPERVPDERDQAHDEPDAD